MCFVIGWQGKLKKSSLASIISAQTDRGGSDGIGIVTAGRVTKALYYDSFFSRLQKLAIGRAGLIHGRYGTQGTVSKTNVQPVRIANGIYGLHNGVFSGDFFDAEKSDSVKFYEKFGQILKKKKSLTLTLKETAENANGSYALLVYDSWHGKIYGVHNNGNMYLHTLANGTRFIASKDISYYLAESIAVKQIKEKKVFEFSNKGVKYIFALKIPSYPSYASYEWETREKKTSKTLSDLWEIEYEAYKNAGVPVKISGQGKDTGDE